MVCGIYTRAYNDFRSCAGVPGEACGMQAGRTARAKKVWVDDNGLRTRLVINGEEKTLTKFGTGPPTEAGGLIQSNTCIKWLLCGDENTYGIL